MSYAFQVIGLRDNSGNAFFDYSRDSDANPTTSTRPC